MASFQGLFTKIHKEEVNGISNRVAFLQETYRLLIPVQSFFIFLICSRKRLDNVYKTYLTNLLGPNGSQRLLHLIEMIQKKGLDCEGLKIVSLERLSYVFSKRSSLVSLKFAVVKVFLDMIDQSC